MMASSTSHAAGVSVSELAGLRVLLVEDSWLLLAAMEIMLHDFGATVVGAAATSAEAEQLATAHHPHVALVDINLRDDERAYGLIDRLHLQGVCVVVITGYLRDALGAIKAEAVLEKPVKEAELLKILRAVAVRATSV